MEKVKPLNGRVILSEWTPKKEEAGIIIPDQKEAEKIFEVIDSGKNKELKKGNLVLIDDYAGKERIILGNHYYFVDFSDIIGLIK